MGKKWLLGVFAFLLAALPCFAKEDAQALLRYEEDGEPKVGVTLSLTYVGQQGDGAYVFSDAFASYGLDGEALSPMLLAGYARKDDLPSAWTGETLANGAATVSGLAAGDYLVMGEGVVPMILTLSEDGPLLDVYLKHEVVTPGTEPIRYQVHKEWDAPEGVMIPEACKVELLQDGVSIREMTLTAEESWSYAWTGLAPGPTYPVLETAVPEGFVVRGEASKDGMVLTNVFVKDEDSSSSEAPSSSEEESSSEEASTQASLMKPEDLETKAQADEKLPSTGMQVWPVILFLGLAGGFGVLGVIFVRRKQK